MDCNNCEGYVFSENKRIIIKWIVPVTSLIGFCFSISCVIIAVTYSENRGTHILISMLCSPWSCFQLLMRRKVIPLLALQYCCKHNAVCNSNGLGSTFVDTRTSLFISKISVEGNTRIPWSEHFYFISNKPIAFVPNHEGNGLCVVKSLAKQGVVILPITETTGVFVAKLVDSITIPTYPKVAYRQQP